MNPSVDFKNKTAVFLNFTTYTNRAQNYLDSKTSDIQFINDVRFEVLAMTIRLGSQNRVYPGDSPEWLKALSDLNNDKHLFVVNNGRQTFRAITLRYGIQLKWLTDTMLMARYLGYHETSLTGLSKRLLGEQNSGFPLDGKKLSAISVSLWRDFCKFKIREIALSERLYRVLIAEMPEVEMALIDQTLKLCLKPHAIDWEQLLNGIERLDLRLTYLGKINHNVYTNRNDSLWIRKYIRENTGSDPGTVDKGKVVIGAISNQAYTILKTLWEIKEHEKEKKELESLRDKMTTGKGTAAFVDLNYSKAVTHRWSSGGEGSPSFNFQNMGRESATRKVWIPMFGHKYVIVDLSQIEARVAAWYAGETELLAGFSSNRCVYCDFGKYVFGHVLDRTLEKPERQICKQAVLGLQFGMGAPRFLRTLQGKIPEYLQQITSRLATKSDQETAAKIVSIYRISYPKIAKLPGAMMAAFQKAVNQGGFEPTTISIGNLGVVTIMFQPMERVLVVQLPSGGRLIYRNIRISMVASKFHPGRTECEVSYDNLSGGNKAFGYAMPFENIVQATARDIMAYQLLEAEKNGLDLRFHTHDEAVFQVPKEQVSEAKLLVERIFNSAHRGMEGLPVACEAHISERYLKT